MAKDVRVKIQLPSGFTDASSKHWPKAPFVHKSDDLYYHEKVADLWMSHIGESVAGRKYIFDKLPDGYTIFAKARNTDKNHVDRYLYGHPKKPFRSPNEFIEHFKWLMTDGTGRCTCLYCSDAKKSRGQGQSSARQSSVSSESTRRKVRKLQGSRGDFASIVELYLNSNDINMTFEDKYNHDKLQAERTFKEIAEGYLQIPSFLPRVGELVLFYANGTEVARFEPETQNFKLFNNSKQSFGTYPNWKAGVISQEPPHAPNFEQLSVLLDDQISKKQRHYLIDHFPDPDESKNEFSAHVYQVSIDHIRPLSMYHEMLSGIPQEKWDKTIHNALKVTSSVAPVDPIILYRDGPKAILECRGVWVGPELWVVGDVVRMKPQKGLSVHGALIISGISLVLEGAENPKSSIYIGGRAFTVDEKYALPNEDTTYQKPLAQEQLKNLPSCFNGYTWYSMCELDKKTGEAVMGNDKEEPCESFLGRLYESKAMEVLIGTTHFDVTYEGIRQGRAWALNNRKYNQWIANQRWLIMNDRLEMLNVDALHGQQFPATADFNKNELPSLNSEAILHFENSEDPGTNSHKTSGLLISSQDEHENSSSLIAGITASKVISSADGDDVEILGVNKARGDTGQNIGRSFKKDNRQFPQRGEGSEGRTNGKHLFEERDGRNGPGVQQRTFVDEDDSELLETYDRILVKRVRMD